MSVVIPLVILALAAFSGYTAARILEIRRRRKALDVLGDTMRASDASLDWAWGALNGIEATGGKVDRVGATRWRKP